MIQKGEIMGHKGVSKRKPKKSKTLSTVNGSSDARLAENSPTQSLVRDNVATLNRGGVNPVAASNKKQRK